jgi:anti-sigma factor RsiW
MLRVNEMPCQELVEVITDYLEGAMRARERRRFERHLAACPHCRNYLEQMRLTIRTVGRIRVESLSPEARDELVRAFRGWNRD